jgi:2-polyprenyl-3-methyl-5-hydroxy-6-metoxy-1,4-benzoquinol methylase
METAEIQRAMDRRTTSCPVCGAGALERTFSRVVLGRHQADYCECTVCGSLVVPEVDWLAEAYDAERIDPDTGAAQRGIICSVFIRAMRGVGLVRRGGRVLDFGAGNGLLVRLLRDQGFDAWGVDKHAAMAVARDWRLDTIDSEGAGPADLVTAIEVFEHLVYPREVLQRMASVLKDDGAILLRTTLYDRTRHDRDWYYLECSGGQHITLFSRDGIRKLAERCGLRATFLPFGFHMLTPSSARPVGALRKGGLFLLSGLLFTVGRSIGLCNCSRSSIDKRTMTPS